MLSHKTDNSILWRLEKQSQSLGEMNSYVVVKKTEDIHYRQSIYVIGMLYVEVRNRGYTEILKHNQKVYSVYHHISSTTILEMKRQQYGRRTTEEPVNEMKHDRKKRNVNKWTTGDNRRQNLISIER